MLRKGHSKVAIAPLPRLQSEEQTSSNASSPRSLTSQRKKFRVSKGRAKTGCWTCKIRRIKCDETKPNCLRCTSTGRTCDGYGSSPSGRLMSDYVTPLPPSVSSVLDSSELRAFSHFSHHLAPTLSGLFDAAFWMDLVLRVGSTEPAVRHALIAFDALSERMSSSTVPRARHNYDTKDDSKDWRNDPFAIVQYNKAIKCLVDKSASSTGADVIMLVCILFVCIEALRSEIETAIVHFNGGIRTAIHKLRQSPDHHDSLSTKRMERYVLPSLYRIELLSILFENKPSWPYLLDLNSAVPEEFVTFTAARDSLIHIMNLIMRFLREVGNRRYQRLLTAQDYAQQTALQEALKSWATKHNDLVANSIPTSQRDVSAARILRMHYLIGTIMLARSMSAEESMSDQLTSEFETAVAMAEAVAKVSTQLRKKLMDGSKMFLLDMELVSPLYFVAVKCRHPKIRRRALTLLQTLHRQEAFFDSDLAAALAERIMGIEEAHLAVFDGSELPPERDRIHHTDIKMAFEGARCISVFHMKPDGLDGPWKTVFADFGTD